MIIYVVKIIPLLFLTIGAFFWDWKINFIVILALIVYISVFQKKLVLRAIQNLIFLIIFTLPIVLIKLFTVKEGKKLHFMFFDFYSSAVSMGVNSLFRVLVLALCSYLILKIVLPLEKFREMNNKNNLIEILFLSITIYQEMLSNILSYFRKLRKEKKSMIGFIDNSYKQGLLNYNKKINDNMENLDHHNF